MGKWTKLKLAIASAISLLAIAAVAKASMEAYGLGFVVPQIDGVANVRNPQEGELVFDSTTDTFYGRDNNSTWLALGGASAAGNPVGAIIAYGGMTAPTGYLICDGSAVSRTTYATLFAAIGTAFGAGDGSTTFNLPDLRGRFLRGVDGAASNDPDHSSRTAMATGGSTGNAVGSVQGDATKKNGLALSDPGHSHTETIATNSGSGNGVQGQTLTNSSFANAQQSTASATTGITLGSGDNETRPKNAYVNFIIKSL